VDDARRNAYLAGDFTIDLFHLVAVALAAKRELSLVIMTWGINVYDFLFRPLVCVALDCRLSFSMRW